MKTALFIAIIVIAIIPLKVTFEKRDAQLMRSVSLYEQCVKAEYGMTPIQWYEEHHKYPVCGN